MLAAFLAITAILADCLSRNNYRYDAMEFAFIAMDLSHTHIQQLGNWSRRQRYHIGDDISGLHFTFTYPVVWLTVGAPQMTRQPASSIPLASRPSSWRRPASCQSIPGCCPPISFSFCLFFSLLALCPAGLS